MLVAAFLAAWGLLELGLILSQVDWITGIITKLRLPFDIFDIFYALSYVAFFTLTIGASVLSWWILRSLEARWWKRAAAMLSLGIGMVAIPTGVISYFFI